MLANIKLFCQLVSSVDSKCLLVDVNMWYQNFHTYSHMSIDMHLPPPSYLQSPSHFLQTLTRQPGHLPMLGNLYILSLQATSPSTQIKSPDALLQLHPLGRFSLYTFFQGLPWMNIYCNCAPFTAWTNVLRWQVDQAQDDFQAKGRALVQLWCVFWRSKLSAHATYECSFALLGLNPICTILPWLLLGLSSLITLWTTRNTVYIAHLVSHSQVSQVYPGHRNVPRFFFNCLLWQEYLIQDLSF